MKTVAILALAATLSTTAVAQEIQGHRGTRGLMPENTIPAFAKALSLGVDNLELDLQITKDGKLVIWHDPVLKSYLARNPDGSWVADNQHVIWQMTFDELRRFDVGRVNKTTKYGQTYPEQAEVDGTHIATFDEFIALVRKSGNDRIRFNIEIKLDPRDAPLTAPVEQHATMAVKAIRDAGIADRTTVISFNWATTAAVARLAPELKIGQITFEANSQAANILRGQPGPGPWLNGHDVDNYASVPQLVKASGAHVWVSYWRNVTPELVKEAHQLGLKVNVWTVNDPPTMAQMLDLGVDGITTDYPDRLRAVMQARGLTLPNPSPVAP